MHERPIVSIVEWHGRNETPQIFELAKLSSRNVWQLPSSHLVSVRG